MAKEIPPEHLVHLGEVDFGGAEVRIPTYNSLADYRFFRPATTQSMSWLKSTTRNLAQAIRNRNGRPKIITINRGAFHDWLIETKMTDSPASRAKYISTLTDDLAKGTNR